jgi:hypothetical protein
MHQRTSKRTWVVWAAGLMMVAGSSVALGQAADPMAGPKVEDKSLPGNGGKFGEGQGERRERPIPHRLFLRAVMELGKESSPVETRLSDEQRGQIKGLNEAFVSDLKAYAAEHKEEIKELRPMLEPRERGRLDRLANAERELEDRREMEQGQPRDARGGGRGRWRGPEGERGGEDKEPAAIGTEQERTQARERVRELMEGAPRPEDVQSDIFAVLTDAQREAVKKNLDKARESMRGGPMGGEGFDREAMRERLKNMSPEEREQFREQMRERFQERRARGEEPK